MSNEEQIAEELEKSWDNGYAAAEKAIAISLMHYLDDHRPENKMCLSNGECAQIENAVHDKDWELVIKYIKKYTKTN